MADSDLSRLSRYEAFFTISAEINASTKIEQVGHVLATKLKFVADVFSWRYFCIQDDFGAGDSELTAIVVDGFRGIATVANISPSNFCDFEMGLWRAKKSRLIDGKDLREAQTVLPDHFKRDSIAQIYACSRVSTGEFQSMVMFSKKHQAFNDLDIKFLNLAAQFFHDKVYRLWEERKMRDLENAYLQREIMLRQSEKLATLGRLSAGMAHELNNPAAASQRSAEQLRSEIGSLIESQRQLGEMRLGLEQSAAVQQLLSKTGDRARRPIDMDALALSDLEERLENWLVEHGFEEAWDVAHALATIGLDEVQLTEISKGFENEQLPVVIASLSSTYLTQMLVEEIREGTRRISEIVKALKSYSYLDQAPIQNINIHEGLDNTLIILRSKLKKGVSIQLEYSDALPEIEAYGTELNQVWTNIIDNAVAAMKGEGILTIRTLERDDQVVVEIEDSGPGIPDEIRDKLFEPFFTTKPPGEGTGLGLSISHNIVVQKHNGNIEVRSGRDGKGACFIVSLAKTLPEETTEETTEE